MHIYIHIHSCRYIRTSSCRRTRGSIYARLVNRSASGWRMKWCARRISHVHVKYLLCKWYVGRGGRSATEIPRVSVFFGVYRWKIIGRPNNSCRWDIPAEGYRDHANRGRFVGEGMASIADLCRHFRRKFTPWASGPSQGRVRSCRVS